MEGTRLLRDNERATTNTAIDQSASWEDPGPPSGHYIELRNQAQGRVSEAQLEPSPLTSSSPSLYETGGSNGGRGKPPVYTTVQGRHQGHVPSSRSKCGHPDWFWETLSIVVAIVALAAMVITLVLHRDRPLPNWPFAITINALVAVFSAILKACLVMPIAECISQLKWLWFQKPRPLNQIDQWDLASRGRSGIFFWVLLSSKIVKTALNILVNQARGGLSSSSSKSEAVTLPSWVLYSRWRQWPWIRSCSK